MAEIKIQNFDQKYEKPAAEMKKIADEVMRRKIESGAPDEREIIKQTIAPTVLSQPQKPVSVGEPSSLPDYLGSENEEVKRKIGFLVDFAISEGIGKAVQKANDETPFLIDAFHDALAERLHSEMKKQNLI